MICCSQLIECISTDHILAFDLYGDSALWWVFKARNPNAIDDPIFDFQAGMKIYIPNKGTLEAELGV